MRKGSDVPDLVLLEHINENEVSRNLQVRHKKDEIYTYIGPVLLSVNPFHKLNIYGERYIQKYNDRYSYENPPHIFAMGEDAIRLLRVENQDQCILISGESGAGKTEASKLLLQYISAVTGDAADITRVKNRLIQSNPVIEAFGNAQTLRNSNSSRFGKYMEILFDEARFAPIGGTVRNFLLEKSRVVHPNKGERNFHIFYQLLNGFSSDQRVKYHLEAAPEDFNYLNVSECYQADRINDRSEFSATVGGLQALGVNTQMIDQIFRVVAACLWIGQLEFQTTRDKEDAEVPDSRAVKVVSELLGIEEHRLKNALVSRTINAGHNAAVKSLLTQEKAVQTRDALAKLLYFRLFQHVIGIVNSALKPQRQPNRQNGAHISILDIYGFECFQVNSLEQFLINYANEKLHQVFIQNTLFQEQQEYKKEGIAWEEVEFFDNQVVCEVIESRPYGILAFLDETCLLPKSRDIDFLESMDKNFTGCEYYQRPSRTRDTFCVCHFAGVVEYSIDGFSEKNKDLTWKDLIQLGQSSSFSLLHELFPENLEQKKGASKRPASVSSQFRSQINDLTHQLSLCTPHAIRCIKPNDQKRAGVFTEELVRNQIKYLGLVETVRVRRAGFAHRTPFERFIQRYKMLSPATWPNSVELDEVQTTKILNELGFREGTDFELGKSKVFLRQPSTLFALEEKRTLRIDDLVVGIQRVYRSFIARKLMKERRRKAIGLFGNQKLRRRVSFPRLYCGDYIQAESNEMIRAQLEKFGRQKIHFADTIQKINRRFKEQQRTIVLTDQALYNFTLGNTRCRMNRRVTLESISSLNLSSLADNFVVVHVPQEYDYVFLSDRKTEFATALNDVVLAATGRTLAISFGLTLKYMTKNGKEWEIEFQANEAENETMYVLPRGKDTTIRVKSGCKAVVKNIQVDDFESGGYQKSPSLFNHETRRPVVQAKAMYEFEPTSDGELALALGDRMEILEKSSDGWFKVRLNGRDGYVPGAYVQEIRY